ncbi:hypothetical protein QR98_0006610 [Sarcoptes scabiei]|uniref:Uncharacterized protein n=1 Tax=Sarcoptes scabiei TaxID=52283 RepID=A0A131ZTU6_SARSC|nr:hypothetical protein QR98_0006610 [Sarcoptes scabiei]
MCNIQSLHHWFDLLALTFFIRYCNCPQIQIISYLKVRGDYECVCLSKESKLYNHRDYSSKK